MMITRIKSLLNWKVLLATLNASIAFLLASGASVADEPAKLEVKNSIPISQYIEADSDKGNQRIKQALLAPLSDQQFNALADQAGIPELPKIPSTPVFEPTNIEPRSLRYKPDLFEAPPLLWVPVSYQEVVDVQPSDYQEPVAGTSVITADTPLSARKVKQSLKNPKTAQPTFDLTELPEDHPVRVLMGIRNRLGSVTDGTSFEADDTAAIADAIQAEIDQEKRNLTSARKQTVPTDGFPVASERTPHHPSYPAVSPYNPRPYPTPHHFPANSGDQQVSVLRQTATDLDNIANRLEEIGSYANADQLRQKAQEIRIEARAGFKKESVKPATRTPSREPARIRPSSSTRIEEDGGLQASTYAETLREATHVTHWSFPEIAKDIQARQYQQEIYRLNKLLKDLRRKEF